MIEIKVLVNKYNQLQVDPDITFNANSGGYKLVFEFQIEPSADSRFVAVIKPVGDVSIEVPTTVEDTFRECNVPDFILSNYYSKVGISLRQVDDQNNILTACNYYYIPIEKGGGVYVF